MWHFFTRWWFQIFFVFTPILGKDEPILTSIFFQMDGFNHQAAYHLFHRCFQKYWYPRMDDLKWKTLLKWMIWGENPLFSEPSPSFRLLLSCPFFGGVWTGVFNLMGFKNSTPGYGEVEGGGVQIFERHGPVFQRMTVNIATPFFLVVFFLEIYLGGSWW